MKGISQFAFRLSGPFENNFNVKTAYSDTEALVLCCYTVYEVIIPCYLHNLEIKPNLYKDESVFVDEFSLTNFPQQGRKIMTKVLPGRFSLFEAL